MEPTHVLYPIQGIEMRAVDGSFGVVQIIKTAKPPLFGGAIHKLTFHTRDFWGKKSNGLALGLWLWKFYGRLLEQRQRAKKLWVNKLVDKPFKKKTYSSIFQG